MKSDKWIRDQESFAPYYVSGKWKKESTLASPDVRKVEFDGKVFTANYAGRSQNAKLEFEMALDDARSVRISRTLAR